MPPPKGEHGGVEMAVAGAIERYLYGWAVALGWQESDGRAARQRLVGYLGGGEQGIRFSLPDDPDQVRGVDVLYLTPDQYTRHARVLAEEYIPTVPALCIEVISPSQSADEVDERVQDYLAGGAQMVWRLFPAGAPSRSTRRIARPRPCGPARRSGETPCCRAWPSLSPCSSREGRQEGHRRGARGRAPRCRLSMTLDAPAGIMSHRAP